MTRTVAHATTTATCRRHLAASTTPWVKARARLLTLRRAPHPCCPGGPLERRIARSARGVPWVYPSVPEGAPRLAFAQTATGGVTCKHQPLLLQGGYPEGVRRTPRGRTGGSAPHSVKNSLRECGVGKGCPREGEGGGVILQRKGGGGVVPQRGGGGCPRD